MLNFIFLAGLVIFALFPIVFVLAPTGLGLIGAAVANLLYLLLDIYTKIVFNVQLSRAS
jgi:bacteriorhodopsin